MYDITINSKEGDGTFCGAPFDGLSSNAKNKLFGKLMPVTVGRSVLSAEDFSGFYCKELAHGVILHYEEN